MMHGQGIYTYPKDATSKRYEGQFKCNLRDGYGILTFNDGSLYEGQWKDDIPNGAGRVLYSGGQIVNASFKDGNQNMEKLETMIRESLPDKPVEQMPFVTNGEGHRALPDTQREVPTELPLPPPPPPPDQEEMMALTAEGEDHVSPLPQDLLTLAPPALPALPPGPGPDLALTDRSSGSRLPVMQALMPPPLPSTPGNFGSQGNLPPMPPLTGTFNSSSIPPSTPGGIDGPPSGTQPSTPGNFRLKSPMPPSTPANIGTMLPGGTLLPGMLAGSPSPSKPR